jgi:hypothetical protein
VAVFLALFSFPLRPHLVFLEVVDLAREICVLAGAVMSTGQKNDVFALSHGSHGQRWVDPERRLRKIAGF